MRGKVAKRIRNEVYGDLSPRPEARRYFAKPLKNKGSGRHTASGTIIADAHRRLYQDMKKQWVQQRKN